MQVFKHFGAIQSGRPAPKPIYTLDPAWERDAGPLKAGAREGVAKIMDYLAVKRLNKFNAAYFLATAWHETARWMQPIREGATRYGTNYTDAQSRAAVAAIFNKGIIKTNYALPTGPYKQSYYGRGLTQITWYDNYLKFEKLLNLPLTRTPDIALQWGAALDIQYYGMVNGMFRKGLSFTSFAQDDFYNMRDIINGDKKQNGQDIATYARMFLKHIKA